MTTDFGDELRRLSQRAWGANEAQLAIELEAVAFRCCGVNLDAERRQRLDAIHARSAKGAQSPVHGDEPGSIPGLRSTSTARPR